MAALRRLRTTRITSLALLGAPVAAWGNPTRVWAQASASPANRSIRSASRTASDTHGLRSPAVTTAATQLQQYFQVLARVGFSGQILVAQHDRILLEQGYGIADAQTNRPITSNTQFNVASVSKQFTAAAILLLESQGKLQLSDKISQFFPAAPADKSAITIEQLLTHTAGIADDYDLYSRHPYLQKDELLQFVFAKALRSKPGEKSTYSNDGYAILAAIIEAVSGESFETYLRQSLFEPAGMRATTFVGESPAATMAKPYDAVDESMKAGNWSGGLGGSNVVSTAQDLYRWYQAIQGTALLPAAQRAEFFSAHTDKTGLPLKYGYGWWFEITPRKTLAVWHSGHAGGYSAMFRMLVDEDVVIIFLSNASIADFPLREGLFRTLKPNAIEQILFGQEYIHPPGGRELSVTERRELPGVYLLPDGSALTACTMGDAISVMPSRQAGFQLLFPQPIPGDSAIYAELGIQLPLADPKIGDLSRETEQTRGFLDQLTHDNLEGLRQAAGDQAAFAQGPPFDLFLARWGELIRQNGPIVEIDVLGSYPIMSWRSDMESVTYSIVRFRKAAVYFQWRWSGEHVVTVVEGLHHSPVPAFVPTHDNEMANFDLFTNGNARLEVVRDDKGRVTGLLVGGPARQVLARRQSEGLHDRSREKEGRASRFDCTHR